MITAGPAMASTVPRTEEIMRQAYERAALSAARHASCAGVSLPDPDAGPFPNADADPFPNAADPPAAGAGAERQA
jgi:hypothetical protein